MSELTSTQIDLLEKHRSYIRKNAMKVTPYRLGQAVGWTYDDVPCPYENMHSRRAYRKGFEYGRMARKRESDLNKRPPNPTRPQS